MNKSDINNNMLMKTIISKVSFEKISKDEDLQEEY